MSSLFGSTHPLSGTGLTGSGSSGLFGTSSLYSANNANTNSQFSNLGSFGSQQSSLLQSNPQQNATFQQNLNRQQNVSLNSQQRPVVDSRSTVRQLTTLIPEWRGHFDLAELMMSSQEQMLNNVGTLVSELALLSSSFEKTSELTRGALSDINLQQNALNRDLTERLACQDAQNLTTIKSRRLCEALISNSAGMTSSLRRHDPYGANRSVNDLDSRTFKVPNHINVNLSRELYDRVRRLKSEVENVQNEVQMLKDIDLSQAPNFIESVLASQYSRMVALGNTLTQCLNQLDLARPSTKDAARSPGPAAELGALYEGLGKVWANVTGEVSALRRTFLDSVGVVPPKSEPPADDTSELKRQIRYLKRFNSSYGDSTFPYSRDLGYNIKDLLTNTVPNQSFMMPTNTTSNLFGTSSNLTGSTNLYGGSTGLFGTTGSSLLGGGTTGLGTTGLGTTGLGTTGLGTTGSGLLGSTTTGGTGLFGSTNTGGGLFGSSLTSNTTNTGTTGLFGSTNTATTGTTTGTGLFGSTTLGQSQNTQPAFGTTGSTTTGLGLFGSSQPQNTQQSSLFGSTNTGGGLFGSTTSTNTGTTGLFGTTPSTTTGTTGLFGSTATNTGTSTTSTGLFGSTANKPTGATSLFGSNTGTTFGSNTGTAFGSNTGNTFGSTTGSAFGTNTGNAFGTNTGSTFGTSTNTGFGTTNTSAFGSGGSSIFGSGSASTSTLFGSSTQPKSTGTELALYNPNTFTNFNRK